GMRIVRCNWFAARRGPVGARCVAILPSFASLSTDGQRRSAIALDSPRGPFENRPTPKNRGPVMIVGVPKEVKTDEYRVAMIPVGVEELTRAGHQVLIQSGAGQGSGISDEQYAMHGAEMVSL